MKSKIGRILISGMLILIILQSYLMPVVSFAAQNNNVKVANYNNYTIYYSDDYFRHPSTEYDEHLATTSIIMTDCTVPRENPKSANDTEWYQNQPELLHGYFDAIGFENFETNDDYRNGPEFDTIGLAAAIRKVDDFTVIAVTVRSGGYFHEWANNVWLGTGGNSDYMHEGWYNAANKLIEFLNNYATSKNITGKVKVWIAGFSRGGATSNIAAGLLDNDIYNNKKIFKNGATLAHDDLYAYTFEAPQGANYNCIKNKRPGDPIYNNIWNIVNPNDLVTKIAMSDFGFTRFGTDKYITTKFYDTENFTQNREVFKKLLDNNDNYSDYKGDTFDMYEISDSKQFNVVIHLANLLMENFTEIGSMTAEDVSDAIQRALYDSTWVVKNETKKNYDSNIVSSIILEEGSKSISSRKEYTEKYQEHLKKLLYEFMNDVKEEAEANEKELWDCVITSLVVGAVTDYYTLGTFGASDIARVWAAISSNPTIGYLQDSIEPLLSLVTDIYSERPNEVLSLAKQTDNVFDNHQFEVNVAHLEAQDSYYVEPIGLNKVSLRKNADYGRISFKDFNDIELHENDGNGTKRVIKVNSRQIKDSDIVQVNDGYAAGYYNYSTERKVELFTPVTHNYIVNMKGYSEENLHDVTFIANYYFIGPNNDGRYKLSVNSYKDTVVGDSDFVEKGVNFKNVYERNTGTAFSSGNIHIIIWAVGIMFIMVVGIIFIRVKKKGQKNKEIENNDKK